MTADAGLETNMGVRVHAESTRKGKMHKGRQGSDCWSNVFLLSSCKEKVHRSQRLKNKVSGGVTSETNLK